MFPQRKRIKNASSGWIKAARSSAAAGPGGLSVRIIILEGHGSMQVGAEVRPVGPGDAIAIPPGARHQIRNTGPAVLKFLCCCAPAYEDQDTVLEEDG
jgi:uncharacterized RmlC-like cupin family protein